MWLYTRLAHIGRATLLHGDCGRCKSYIGYQRLLNPYGEEAGCKPVRVLPVAEFDSLIIDHHIMAKLETRIAANYVRTSAILVYMSMFL